MISRPIGTDHTTGSTLPVGRPICYCTPDAIGIDFSLLRQFPMYFNEQPPHHAARSSITSSNGCVVQGLKWDAVLDLKVPYDIRSVERFPSNLQLEELERQVTVLAKLPPGKSTGNVQYAGQIQFPILCRRHLGTSGDWDFVGDRLRATKTSQAVAPLHLAST
ncbi:hypothetical protein BV22DRAFT_1153883 [Leucogyrophana mollusca]|uniref:Uncharacterized protein n=1 Tax=Leucogyrophana mollusca TaxID=85980 RepID=A0ACB8BNU9_9AGAM|nr:hypothetical protein BV22DRAFT_1153883 [Leucogyrophana mollusca]